MRGLDVNLDFLPEGDDRSPDLGSIEQNLIHEVLKSLILKLMHIALDLAFTDAGSDVFIRFSMIVRNAAVIGEAFHIFQRKENVNFSTTCI